MTTKAEMRTFHVAAEPVDLVQRCVRCGRVLVDNNGVMVLDHDNRGPMFFPAYRLIGESGSGRWVVTDAEAYDDDVSVNLCKRTSCRRPRRRRRRDKRLTPS